MKETIDTITNWHRDTFPDVTLPGQLIKFAEEMNEFDVAINSGQDALSELADMIIVAAGIRRFDELFASAFVQFTYMEASDVGFDMTELWDAIQKKMAKNRKRVWNKTGNGNYHHENGIED
jgi:hypothetical protein